MNRISRRGLGALAAGAATSLAGPWRPARAQGAETIKLGFTAALTGPFNEFGEGIRRGAELAVARNQWPRVASSAARWRLGRGAGRSAGAGPRGAEHAPDPGQQGHRRP